MKKILMISIAIILVLVLFGCGQNGEIGVETEARMDLETEEQEEIIAVSVAPDSLEFSSLEEFLLSYISVKDGMRGEGFMPASAHGSFGFFSEMAESIDLLSLERFYLPVNIPEEYILFSIRVTEYYVSLWFLPEENLGSELDIINAIAFGQHFGFSVTRNLNWENPMIGIMEQHGVTEADLIDGKYLFREPNSFRWASGNELLHFVTPESPAVGFTESGGEEMVRYAEIYTIDLTDEDAIKAFLGEGPSNHTATITFNFYGRSDTPVVMPIQRGQPLCPVMVADITRQVVGDGVHDNNDGWAFWGWFTDEQLNSSRRTRNGYRRPTVGALGFDLNTVITGALINSLAVNGNIDLYAVWVRWGDMNDDGLINGIDVSLISQYVRRFPGISIVRPALYVSRNTLVTGLDVSLMSQYVRRFPGIVLGRVASATPVSATFDARGGDHQAWSVSHEIGSRGGYVDVRLKMDQITSYGMCWTMFTLNFDTSVLSNPRLSPRIDRNALPPDLQEAYDTLPPSLFGTVLGPFRGGNASLHNMIFEGVISWQPDEAIVSWQSNPNPAIPGNFSSGIFVDIRFDILENAPVGESLVTISKQPGDVFLGGVGALVLPIAWDQLADGSVTVSP